MRSREEIEGDRLERLAELEQDHTEDPDWKNRFAPGTFGCHEALHLASVIERLVEQDLAEHPAVVLKPRWFQLASRASDALAELYQEIGKVHLEA
jgi:hypothetical protein